MDKFDQYKRLLRLGIAGLEILMETVFYAMVWFSIYVGRIASCASCAPLVFVSKWRGCT